LANGVPLESVAKMLGHKKLSTTQVYAQVLEQKLTLDTEVLRGKFSQSNNSMKAAE
jgi:site-specific recombinase XerD